MSAAGPLGSAGTTLWGQEETLSTSGWSRDFSLNRSRNEKDPVLTAAVNAFNAMNALNYTSWTGDLRSPFFGPAVASAPARRVEVAGRFRF